MTFADGIDDDEAREMDRFFTRYRLYLQSVRKCEEWLSNP